MDENGYRLDADEIHDDAELERIMAEEEAAAEAAEAARRAAPYAGGFDTPGSAYSTLSYRSMSARRRSVFSGGGGGGTPRARSTGRKGSRGGFVPPTPPQHAGGTPNAWGQDAPHTPGGRTWGSDFGGDVVPPPAPHFG